MKSYRKGSLINKIDNTKYIGNFKNGLRHGLGTIFLTHS